MQDDAAAPVQPDVSIEVDDVDPHTQLLGASGLSPSGALSSGRPFPARSSSLGTPGSAPSVKAKQVRTAKPVGALLVANCATGGDRSQTGSTATGQG